MLELKISQSFFQKPKLCSATTHPDADSSGKARLADRKEPCEPLLNTDCAAAPQPNTCAEETERKPCLSNARACYYFLLR